MLFMQNQPQVTGVRDLSRIMTFQGSSLNFKIIFLTIWTLEMFGPKIKLSMFWKNKGKFKIYWLIRFEILISIWKSLNLNFWKYFGRKSKLNIVYELSPKHSNCNYFSQAFNQLVILREILKVSIDYFESANFYDVVFRFGHPLNLNPAPDNQTHFFCVNFAKQSFSISQLFPHCLPKRENFCNLTPFLRQKQQLATFSTLNRKWWQMKKRFFNQFSTTQWTMPWTKVERKIENKRVINYFMCNEGRKVFGTQEDKISRSFMRKWERKKTKNLITFPTQNEVI